MVGGGIEILGRAAVALDRAQSASPLSTGEQPEPEQLRQQLLHRARARALPPSGAGTTVAVGAADAKLLDFEAAAEFDHRVEDLLHDVRVDQMALGFDNFWNRKLHSSLATGVQGPR